MAVFEQMLREIDRGLSRISRWPWRADGGTVVAPAVRGDESEQARGSHGLGSWTFYGGHLVAESMESRDAAFVADAPGAIAWLVDLVRLMDADRRRLEFLLDERYAAASREEVDALMRRPALTPPVLWVDVPQYEIINNAPAGAGA